MWWCALGRSGAAALWTRVVQSTNLHTISRLSSWISRWMDVSGERLIRLNQSAACLSSPTCSQRDWISARTTQEQSLCADYLSAAMSSGPTACMGDKFIRKASRNSIKVMGERQSCQSSGCVCIAPPLCFRESVSSEWTGGIVKLRIAAV